VKILFVISTIGIGGEQRVASILTDLFIKRGILVDIATFKKNKKKYHINKNININTKTSIALFSIILYLR